MRPERGDGATGGPDGRAASTHPGFPVRLSTFYAALFALVGVVTPFFPVWLAACGLDAQEIGILLGLPVALRMIAVPLVTRLADHRGAVRQALILACWGTALGYGAVALSAGFAVLLATVTLMSLAYAPVMALADAYAIQRLKESGRAYGPVRLWGSLTFMAANVGAGLMLDVLPASSLILPMIAAAAASGIAAMALRPVAPPTARPDETRAFGLLRQPAFVAVLLAANLVQASHAVYYGFSTIAWNAAGLDGLTIGALWALGVVAEIVLFALQGRFPPAIGPIALLLIGAGAAFLRWMLMAFDPPAAALPFLQCLHGLSFGATHLGTIGFIARAAPARFGATTQGLFYAINSPVMAAMLGASGFLYAAYGAGAYAAMAAAAGLAFLLVLAARGRAGNDR